MMAKIPLFVKMPTGWVEEGGLKNFDWKLNKGPNNIAALIVLTALLHRMDKDVGICRMTYNDIERATNISRAKVAAGLDTLADQDLIVREAAGRSTYQIKNYNAQLGWAKFPAGKMYFNDGIMFFRNCHLRKRTELDALKLFFLFASRRDRNTNMAKISYDKITEMTGITRFNIRPAISFLAANNVVHVEHLKNQYDHGIANAYRLAQLDGYRHMGTIGRNDEYDEFTQEWVSSNVVTELL